CRWPQTTPPSSLCSASWKKRSNTCRCSRPTTSWASAPAPTSSGPARVSSNTSVLSRDGARGSALRHVRRSRSIHDEDELSQLAALVESLVGRRRLVERIGGLDEHARRAVGEERDGMRLCSPRDQRLLLQRPGAQRRTGDERPLAHDREQVDLGG